MQGCFASSQRLKITLETTKVHTIAKAFPDWQEADSIAYNESGERVKKPEFHRVFTLAFPTEKDADEAIKKLNGLYGGSLCRKKF